MSEEDIVMRKVFGDAETMQENIVSEFKIQIANSDMRPFRKARILKAIERPRVRQALLDRVLTEAFEQDAVEIESMNDEPSFAVDWQKIIDIIIKLLPLLLMFL